MNPKIDSTKKSWSNTKRLNHLSILVMENNTKSMSKQVKFKGEKKKNPYQL